MAKNYSKGSSGSGYEKSVSTDRGRFKMKGGTGLDMGAVPTGSKGSLGDGASGSAGGYTQGTGGGGGHYPTKGRSGSDSYKSQSSRNKRNPGHGY